MNRDEIFPAMEKLVNTAFFSYFKVDLYCECPFWPDDGMCSMRCVATGCSWGGMGQGVGMRGMGRGGREGAGTWCGRESWDTGGGEVRLEIGGRHSLGGRRQLRRLCDRGWPQADRGGCMCSESVGRREAGLMACMCTMPARICTGLIPARIVSPRIHLLAGTAACASARTTRSLRPGSKRSGRPT